MYGDQFNHSLFFLSVDAITIKTQPRKTISTLSEKDINHIDVGQSIQTMRPSKIETAPVILLDMGFGVSVMDKRIFR